MKTFRDLPKELIDAVCQDYISNTIGVNDIARKHKISFGTMMRIIDERQIPRRGNTSKGNRYKKKETIQPFDGRPTKEHTQNTIDAFYDGDGKQQTKTVKPKVPRSKVTITDTKIICECGCKYNPRNAKFCCSCGKQLRTEKEMILMQIEELTSYFTFAADGTRDNFRDAVLSIMKQVEENLKGRDE